ncbi:MAG: hypothetical protein HYX32_04540 [Actinobacteria bacterium]|nr:hypothetical protein [Actinomycetota bacterium]
MTHSWTVELEATRGRSGQQDDSIVGRLARLPVEVEASADRYRLHFEVFGDDLNEATRTALGHWWHLLEVARLPHWSLTKLGIEMGDEHTPGDIVPISVKAVTGTSAPGRIAS